MVIETKDVVDQKDDFFEDHKISAKRRRQAEPKDDDVIEIKQAEDDEKPFEIEWAQVSRILMKTRE